MSIESVLLLIAFVFPGAIAVSVWDYATQHTGRAIHSHFAWGLLISLMVYFIPHSLMLVDLLYLFDLTGGIKPDIRKLLEASSVEFFVVACILCAGGGLAIGRFAQATIGQKLAMTFVGRTLTASTWAETFRPAVGTYVHIHSKQGFELIGCLYRVPEQYENAFISLTNTLILVKESWQPTSYQIALIPIGDIIYMELAYQEEELPPESETGDRAQENPMHSLPAPEVVIPPVQNYQMEPEHERREQA